jgi:protein phosphatase
MSLCCYDQLIVAHVGDSRAYRLRQGQLHQITRDHSVVQEQIDAGLISVEAAQYSATKNLLTRAIGVAAPVEVEINFHQVEPGDLYMLCSDGLTNMVSVQKLQETLQKNTLTLGAMCQELIDQANSEGGHDNISVALFKVKTILN